jgi:hypothetical protein
MKVASGQFVFVTTNITFVINDMIGGEIGFQGAPLTYS